MDLRGTRGPDAPWPDPKIAVALTHARAPDDAAYQACAYRNVEIRSQKPGFMPATDRHARKNASLVRGLQRFGHALLSRHPSVVLPPFRPKVPNPRNATARQDANAARCGHRGPPASDWETKRPPDCSVVMRVSLTGSAVEVSTDRPSICAGSTEAVLSARGANNGARVQAEGSAAATAIGPARSPPPKEGTNAAT